MQTKPFQKKNRIFLAILFAFSFILFCTGFVRVANRPLPQKKKTVFTGVSLFIKEQQPEK